MARTASVAVAGYYPTPSLVTPLIASLLQVDRSEKLTAERFCFVDPCAGDGTAIWTILQHLLIAPEIQNRVATLSVCEMEETRAAALSNLGEKLPWHAFDKAEGDAFRLTWKTRSLDHHRVKEGATLLFLNPPYDTDPVHGRLEERFLARFTGTLCEDGILVFVVPFYALKASASTIARHYHQVHCFRFPEAEFGAYKQVVLVATKRTLLEPDTVIVDQIRAWAADASGLPELGTQEGPIATIPAKQAGFHEWRMTEVDLTGLLAKYKPWHTTERGGKLVPIAGVLPAGQAIDVLTRNYPVAMPPRPAHIAAGIAAGVFNGALIEPDTDKSLPNLLVKGVFNREFRIVDERKNKDGETTGKIQIQQPQLVVTALDLREKRFHTIASSAEVTGAKDIASMTTGDLLTAYGKGLMRVMLDHCPVMHDPSKPEDQIQLPEFPRKLYKAQEQAVMASVKLLGGVKATKAQRRGKAAFVLGEIGSGKSTVALATAQTVGAKRVLIMCPPHLLDSWKDQTAAVLPWAKVVTLGSVEDVDALIADERDMVVAIMSREAAKLGHAWSSVKGHCPKCGAEVPIGDLAKSRTRCSHQKLLSRNPEAKLARKIALRMLPAAAHSPVVRQMFRGRHMQKIIQAYTKNPVPWGQVKSPLKEVLRPLLKVDTQSALDVTMMALHAIGDDSFAAEVLLSLYAETSACEEECEAQNQRGRIRKALLFVGYPTREALIAKLKEFPYEDRRAFGRSSWDETEQLLNEIARHGAHWNFPEAKMVDGALHFYGTVRGSVEAGIKTLSMLVNQGHFVNGPECGEPLYQAVPEPRRFPLAMYLAKRAPNLIDLLVLDEGHEYAGDGSAQGFAAHRLTGLGIPTLMMTGSVMNGYADSLFVNQWALDPMFRQEFSRDQRQEFVRRYGYLKQLVEEKDREGKTVVFGSVTDRIESVKTIGSAPGVLPLFVLRYLLRLAVTLHKADLALDLPPRRDIVERIEPSKDQAKTLQSLQTRLLNQIRQDQFGPMAGKLWGQMAELPSYLDRATIDVGNGHGDEFVIAYPENEGGNVVARAPLFSADTLLPKEEWLIARVKAELAEGRRVMVFTWHTALMPRLARLLEEHLGEKCPILDASKVAAGKRQAWIDKEVVKKGRRILVVNPVAVQTGLNNLVWFSTEIWMENPACNAIVFRQATGRIDRIGQKQETRIIFPIYNGTPQETLHKLLLHKVAVSMSTDGLDAESALQAAGVGEAQAMSAMAVGRQLYEMLQQAA